MTEAQIRRIKTARTNPGSTDCIETCVEIYKEETRLELSPKLQKHLSDIIDMRVSGGEKTRLREIVEALDGLIKIASKL